MASSSSTSISIFPVLLVNFIGMLGYSIVIPLLVFLVQKFGGNAVIYGVLGAIYPTFQLFGAPLLGRWSDEIGRKRVLLWSQIGTLIAWGLFILALILPVEQLFQVESTLLGTFFISAPLLILFFARALDGLTGGNVSVANAYLSDISTDKTRKGNFGKMASSTSMGFIIGPMIASVLGATIYGELLPIILAALISLIAIFVIKRYLPESLSRPVDPNLEGFKLSKLFQIEHKECYETEHCPEDLTFKKVLGIKRVKLMYGMYFLTFLGFSFFYSAFPVYGVEYLSWNPSKLGIFFTLSSVIMVIIQGPVLSYLADKVLDRWLVIGGSFLLAISFFLLPQGSDFWAYAGVAVLAVGNGLMWPSFLSLLSNVGSPTQQGTIQGFASSMGSAASIVGLVLGGILFGFFGPSLFYVAAGILVFIFLLAFRLPE